MIVKTDCETDGALHSTRNDGSVAAGWWDGVDVCPLTGGEARPGAGPVIMSVGKQSAFISTAGHAFNNPATRAANEPSRRLTVQGKGLYLDLVLADTIVNGHT